MDRDNMIMKSYDIEHEKHLNGLADELNAKFGEKVVIVNTRPGYDTTKRLGEAKFDVWFEEFGEHEDTAVNWAIGASDFWTIKYTLNMMLKLINNPMQDGKPLGWPDNLKIR